MRLSSNKIDDLIQSILGNYIGVGIELGFLDNLYRDLYYVIDYGRYNIETGGRFYGEVEGVLKLLVLVDTDIIEYKKENIGRDKNQIENIEKVKFRSLEDGSCFVEYNSKVITVDHNKLDEKETILFDSYRQINEKRAFILDKYNNLKVDYMETVKYNYSKNKMDDQIIMTTPAKNKNYSEKVYYLDNDTPIKHVIKEYLYPEEIIEYNGFSNSDKYIKGTRDNETTITPTRNNLLFYNKLEKELNDIMYGREEKNKVKTKK